MNETSNREYVQVESPKVAYIHLTDRIVNPVYTSSDGYGKVHIWIENNKYNAGVEIEGRYLPGDELQPKIKVYDIIPICVLEDIGKLPKLKSSFWKKLGL